MNIIELTLFTIVFAFAITLLAYSTPRMTEVVSWWIGIKDARISKRKKDAILENIRQQVTKYWLMCVSGLVIFITSIFWLVNFSTIWKTLLQFLLA